MTDLDKTVTIGVLAVVLAYTAAVALFFPQVFIAIFQYIGSAL